MNIIKCPNCGKENSFTNIKCVNCGTQLIADELLQNEEHNLSSDKQTDYQDFNIRYEELVMKIIGGIIFLIFSVFIVFKGADFITKLFGMPFLICSCAILFSTILNLVQAINMKYKVAKVEYNVTNTRKYINYVSFFGFILFWFGFLIAFDIIAIKSWSNGGNLMFFFSLIFWAVGIYIIIRKIKLN